MEQKKYKVSVVILNWNGEDHLKNFLPGVVKYSTFQDIDIVIADNGSTDGSIRYIKDNFPQIRLLKFDKNYGFTGGYNKALSLIDSDYYVLLNSDIEVTENWIAPIIDLMDQDNHIAAAMPKILSFNNKKDFEYAGASGGYIDKFGYPFCRGRIIGTIEEDKGQYDEIKEIFWASGAAMFVRSSFFHEASGLDDDFFAHMEEIDLCWRFKNKGYKIVVNPESVVYHVGGGTLPNNSPRKIFLNYRNNLILLLKNLPARKLIPIILTRMILDGLSSIIYLVELKFSFFAAVFKAHLSFYRLFFKTHKKRKATQPKQKSVDNIYKKSIVLNYFIKKKKLFKDLNF